MGAENSAAVREVLRRMVILGKSLLPDNPGLRSETWGTRLFTCVWSLACKNSANLWEIFAGWGRRGDLEILDASCCADL